MSDIIIKEMQGDLFTMYEGFKYSEISDILDISTKTVQAQMLKAYKIIKT